jgi:hypothetical protein
MAVDHNDDSKLNARMNAWQTPALPPGFDARIAARIMERQRTVVSVLPWSPLKLVTVTAMAALVGIFLGIAMPVSDAAAETTEIIEMLW